MRCMVIVKATEDSEARVMPSEQDLAEMGSFNEELVEAGVMLDGAGLHPSSEAVRVTYENGEAQVNKGPFTGDLAAGFWVWEVEAIDDAIEWARRIPFNHGESVEIRPYFEPEDFGESYSEELQERDAALEQKIEQQRAK